MIRNGIDNLASYSSILAGKRLGLITNPSGVNAELISTADILARDFRLTALFGPEHGIRGAAQAGAEVQTEEDPILHIPAYSLYASENGDHHIPEEALQRVDALVYDIQDVGVRFYTYIYTLAYAMADAARHQLPIIVLDRIDPLGGDKVEGILLDHKKHASLVGLYPMPARYGLTVGEYARYINETFQIGCELHVVPCDPHPRTMLFPQSGQLWVSPSPNLPTCEAALAYVGTCLFEGTNLSEGRGTTHPFEIIGAPFINAEKLADAMKRFNLPGIVWRPVHFTPTFSKFQDELCHGVQLHIANPHTASTLEAGLLLFQELMDDYDDQIILNGSHFARIVGDEALMTGRETATETIQRASHEARQFLEDTRKFRLY